MPKDEKLRSRDFLGVEKNASATDIRLAFLKKSLQFHPDKNSGESVMARFEDVTQAYSILSDGSACDCSSPDEVFFKFFQEVLRDDNAYSLRAMLQEHDASKCADDEYRCDEDDNEIDIERELSCLLEILRNRRKKGKEIPEDMTQDKVARCKDNLVRQREEAKKDAKKQPVKKGKQQQVPVSKPKPKSKKQLLAEQRRREKEMIKIAQELEVKRKEDEEKEKIRKQMEAEKQKRLEEERKRTEAEARKQREREQKERERLQKLEQERERKQKEEEERRKKEEMKRKKAEQERIEKEKAEKAAKIKAAQQAAKEKEEQAKNMAGNKNQGVKRNQPQRNEQLYPREIPPRFQRRMKQQQQQSLFPHQTSLPMSQAAPIQQQQQPTVQTQQQQQQPKAVTKPTPTGKKKDPNRWTKGEYTGLIEEVQDDLGWSKAPPAKIQNWVDTTGSPSDWGAEGISWGEKAVSEERVIVDKTDQDSWPTVGGKGKNKGTTEQAISGNTDTTSGKENWGEYVSTFGDSLDAVIDGMEAAEEAAGSGSWDSAKWNQSAPEGSVKDSNVDSNSNDSLTQELSTKGNSPQTWSKTPGKGIKLKSGDNKAENSSDSLSSSWEENSSSWKESRGVDDEWKTVGKLGNKGTKNEPSPGNSEESGWGESPAVKRNSGSNWSSSWSSQGLSITGTEIWDQGNNEDKKNSNEDKGTDWLENSGDSRGSNESEWEDVGQLVPGNDDGDGWDGWTTTSSRRNKALKPAQVNDENAWLRRSLKQLVDMGFKEDEGEKALKCNNMSLEGAISHLLGQGTPPGHHSPIILPGNLVPQDHNSGAAVNTQINTQGDEEFSKLNRKQRRRLIQLQQTLSQDTEQYQTDSESLPGADKSYPTNISVNSSSSMSVSESFVNLSAKATSSEAAVEDERNTTESEQQRAVATEARSESFGGVNNPATLSAASAPGSVPVRAPIPSMLQQQLLQQQVQMQLRQAAASGLKRIPLGSQPVVLLAQLSQLSVIQQQLAAQQQLLQKQPQPNALQNQQLALQQQQISVMMTQIQQQLFQQQQQLQQQQQQQQQMAPNRFPGPPQQNLPPSQPQLHQLLLQQRKQQQQQQQQLQQQTQQKSLQPSQGITRANEADSNTERNEEDLRSKMTPGQSVSPIATVGKEPSSIVQVVNSAPASPSTGKSRLGQWTQGSTHADRNTRSPKPAMDANARERNLRASPQPETSEKSSQLITRSTNSPSALQSMTSSIPVHRVLDPVSSKWGVDAAPKLSVEPPEFKPGVPWRPQQARGVSETAVSEGSVTTTKPESQNWSSNSFTTTNSPTYTNTNSNITQAPSKNVSSSQTLPSSAVWQAPVSKPGPARSVPLVTHVRPPPGLGTENSFLHLPDVRQVSQSTDSTWLGVRSAVDPHRQLTSGPPISSGQFAIPRPGVGNVPSPWTNERVGRTEAGWPSSTAQPLDTMHGVPRAAIELGKPRMEIGLNSSVEANEPGLVEKTNLSSQSSVLAMSTWLVLRNISPRVESMALRSLCQQHGPLLTFQLNLRYGNSLIRYGSKEEAAKAHASLNGLLLAGARITADFATDSDIGSFFEQTSDWSTPGAVPPITTWAGVPSQKTELNTHRPGSKSLLPPTTFSPELWSFAQPSAGLGTNVSSVWSTPASSRREGEQSPAITENGVTSPSMVTFLPPGLLNSGESM